MDTPVVVLDEPTTGQDARGVARIRRVIADLSSAGRTVIAISHDMRFVAETFTRIVVMGAGRIVLDGSPETVFAEAEWPTACVDLPRAATGRPGRGAHGRRSHADRGRAHRQAGELRR